jgi:acetyl-CoA carboxylase biotin carboxyl carrier protein
MDVKKIKQIIELVKKEGLSEFSFEDKNEKVKISFAGNQPGVQFAPPIQTVQTQATTAAVSDSKAVSNQPAEDPSVKKIVAPFVGTFYVAPAPGEPSFVKIGDKVRKGQTLCILEAMKIMNEIEADVDGEIVEICVENESFVEFNQVLFKIR